MTSRTSRARCHIRFGCVTLALVVTLTHNPRWVVTYLLIGWRHYDVIGWRWDFPKWGLPSWFSQKGYYSPMGQIYTKKVTETFMSAKHFPFFTVTGTATHHRPRKHGVKGVLWPPTFRSGGQAMLFDPPLFPCVKIHHILLLCSVILLVVSFTCFQVRNNKNILSSLDWSSIRCFHWSVLTALQVQWLAAPLLFTLLLYFIIYIYGFDSVVTITQH